MNILENVQLAWEALLANRMRSALTMLGIIIGVGAVIAVVAIGRGTRGAVLAEFSAFSSDTFQVVAIPPQGGSASQRLENFTDDDIRRIKAAVPEIREVMTSTGWRTQLRAGSKTLWGDIQGNPAAVTRVYKAKLKDGRFYTPAEEAAAARVAVVGPDIARDLFGDRSPVGQVMYAGGYPFVVVGLFDPDTGVLSRAFGSGLERAIMAPLSTIRRITGERESQAILVEVRPGGNVKTTMDDTMAVLKKMHPSAQYVSFALQQITEAVGNVANILTAVIGAIAGISLVVGGVGIMNIMLVSVTERTREIGIRKAIGARRVDILQQFLTEAVFVSLTGGLLGTALAAIPVYVAGRLMTVPLLVSWDSVLLALGFSVAVGVIFGVYPASKAAALDPIDALRYE